MCGFLVYVSSGDNSRIRLRGPDLTTTQKLGGFTFVHNLLSVTGESTPQPFVDGGVVCVYNGEIYNQPFERTDGEVIIPLYRKYGTNFARHLDGEFAIALYDFDESIGVFASDPFRTKPLFVNGAECASYRSGVGGFPVRPNETLVTSLDGEILDRSRVRTWDLEQRKETYDDWILAFEAAVAKRAVDDCVVGLSSGYDSGGLVCALLRSNRPFKCFASPGNECVEVLRARRELVNCDEFSPDSSLLPWLRLNVDDEPYSYLWNERVVGMHLLEDSAALGAATIAKLTRAEGRKVVLSGQGADEVMSDYSPWPEQSQLKGRFPERLELWRNFDSGCQESYLTKEEYMGGAFGIELRYPFLDTAVVQEFLWLSAAAKNHRYKAPLREYLVRSGFPFEDGVKRGFTTGLALAEVRT